MLHELCVKLFTFTQEKENKHNFKVGMKLNPTFGQTNLPRREQQATTTACVTDKTPRSCKLLQCKKPLVPWSTSLTPSARTPAKPFKPSCTAASWSCWDRSANPSFCCRISTKLPIVMAAGPCRKIYSTTMKGHLPKTSKPQQIQPHFWVEKPITEEKNGEKMAKDCKPRIANEPSWNLCGIYTYIYIKMNTCKMSLQVSFLVLAVRFGSSGGKDR